MSIKKDNVSVTAVKYNSQDVNKVILDNKCVWCKPFTYTQGTLPTGVASLTCTRSSTDEPTASTGTIANGGTIYYDDKLYWAATASTGYRITAIKGSGSPVTVSGAITGTTASGLTSARISGTISQGTLPTGVASITCYRKAYNENSFSKYTGSTIYYGDQFYWTATAATEYNNPSLTYNNSSKVYTWNGKQGGSIDSVSASGLSAGSRKSFTISFGTTANKSLYGSWSKSSQTAYYGDKITVSGNSVICYKWDNNSTARWTVKVTASSNDAQYTYSAVTIAESSIASVTAATTFTAYNTRTLNSYTITWKYLSAYPDTWTTATESYSYGATPSRTVSNVTSGNARKVPTGWDNLAAVTGNRTITANYKTQVNATFSGTRCSAKIDNAAVSNTWYDINKTITWTANPNCAFSSDGLTTTINDTISTQKTKYTASADYVNVTKLTGTNCSTNFTTGWKSITDKITWTASTAYAFDTSNTTSKSVAVVPGENKYTASYVKRYTLTISATNASYGTYSVSRTKSPYQGATTGALSNGATIFYGDVLTGTSSAKAVSYDGWSVTSVTAPTATTTGDATSGNLTITNKSSYSATLYYNTSNAVGGTSAGTAAANGSATVTGLEFNKQYYISARVSRTRTKHTYATDGTQYSGTNGVTGNVTATFKFKDTTSTDTGTIDSSVVAAKTAAQNKYTVTFSIPSGQYGSWSTTSIPNVPYGTKVTVEHPSNNVWEVTVGSIGSSTFTPAPTTVQYNYASPTLGYPSSVTRAATVTGGCKRSDRLYTIQWIGENDRTVLETDSNVKYGDVLTYNGSTPSKTSTDQYNYTFSVWKLGSTSGSTVTSGTTTNAGSTSSTTIKIYSTFTSTVRSYTVTFSIPSGKYGSWSTTSIPNVPYGTKVTSKSLSNDDNPNTDWEVTVGNIGSSIFTSPEHTGQYIYESAVLICGDAITSPTTAIIECGCNRRERLYTIQWIGADGSTILETDSNVKYGDVLTYNGATPSKPSTAQYSYAFSAWKLGSTSGSTVISGTTTNTGEGEVWNTIKIYSTFTETLNSYTVTFSTTSGQYGSWSKASIANVPYGTTIARSNNTVTVGNIGSSTFSSPSPDGPYNYASSTYSFPNRVTGATSVTGGCTRSVKQYTLSLTKNDHVSRIRAWRTESPYQGAATSSSSSPLINGTGTATIYYGDSLSMDAEADRYYYFSGNKTTLTQTITTVTNSVSWAPTIAGVTSFNATIAAGEGISNVYLSSDKNATSGSPSGTAFAAGTTVYAFAQLIHSLVPAIIVPSGWVRVDSSGSWIYRVGSAVMGYTGSPNFGTINAGLRSYAVTIKGSVGIDSVFLNTNPDALSGSPSGTEFKATTTVYAFAAVNLHYVHRVPSSWYEVGKSGTSTVYVVRWAQVEASPYDFGTITLPAPKLSAPEIIGTSYNDESADTTNPYPYGYTVTLKNPNSVAATLYYRFNSGSWESLSLKAGAVGACQYYSRSFLSSVTFEAYCTANNYTNSDYTTGTIQGSQSGGDTTT